MSAAPGGITAIPTKYKGCTFRSRLEARWAVFFDYLRIRWDYEPEGYVLEDGTLYLPDFHIPHLDVWIEVKGEHPSPEEESKAQLLAKGTGKNVYLFYGSLPEEVEVTNHLSALSYTPAGGGPDSYYQWCACPTCGKLGIEYNGKGERVCGHSNPGTAGIFRTTDINLAYIRARGFPFDWQKRKREEATP